MLSSLGVGSAGVVTAHPRPNWSAPECMMDDMLATPELAAVAPRVSCIVPTGNRHAALPLLHEMVRRQTLTDVELVVVDGGVESSETVFAGDPLARYVRVPPDTTIGARRNRACELATGEVIIHWDDDDWYAPDRLARQANPILEGVADITGLRCRHVLALAERRWWTMTDWLHARCFVANVHGGTLAFRRSLLGPRVRYPDVSRAEEQKLLSQLIRKGARVLSIDGRDLFAYVRHGRNAWNCEPGKLLRASAWQAGEPPKGMDEQVVSRYAEALASPPLPSGAPAVLRRVSLGSTLVDCFGATEILSGPSLARRDRCIAVVANEAMAPFLNTLLVSLLRPGSIDRSEITVLAVGDGAFAETVARKHLVEVVPCRPLGRAGPSLKGALYVLPQLIDARQFLLLDADTLVLGGVGSLFDQLEAEPDGTTLVAKEGPIGRPMRLGQGLISLYRATPEEASRICPDVAQRDQTDCVNEGVLVTGGKTLAALEVAIRARSDWTDWSTARRDVWWRQKAVVNLALATVGKIAVLEPVDNFQLHANALDQERAAHPPHAIWQGRAVRILHFNGLGRTRWRSWQPAFALGR